MDSEKNIEDLVLAGGLSLPPVELRAVGAEDAGVAADAIIEARWQDQSVRFVAEIRNLATPKSLRQATAVAQQAARPPQLYPMVIAPYLSCEKLRQLEAVGVSGVDLCGNGVLMVPGRMSVFRTGQANRFPQSATLKNVYRGKNSLVGRALLLRPRFDRVKDIVTLLTERGGAVAFSTVSKALKRLEEQLIVSRRGSSTRLLQADVLMDNLAANYQPPAVGEQFVGKCALEGKTVTRQLAASVSREGGAAVLTGSASGERYATMAGEPKVSLYTTLAATDVLAAADLAMEQTDRFANVEILQTTDTKVFFDPRVADGIPYASPIQTWLELAAGSKRQKDAAEQVRRGILTSLGEGRDDGR